MQVAFKMQLFSQALPLQITIYISEHLGRERQLFLTVLI